MAKAKKVPMVTVLDSELAELDGLEVELDDLRVRRLRSLPVDVDAVLRVAEELLAQSRALAKAAEDEFQAMGELVSEAKEDRANEVAELKTDLDRAKGDIAQAYAEVDQLRAARDLAEHAREKDHEELEATRRQLAARDATIVQLMQEVAMAREECNRATIKLLQRDGEVPTLALVPRPPAKARRRKAAP